MGQVTGDRRNRRPPYDWEMVQDVGLDIEGQLTMVLYFRVFIWKPALSGLGVVRPAGGRTAGSVRGFKQQERASLTRRPMKLCPSSVVSLEVADLIHIL